MSKLFVLFNHSLTAEQLADAQVSLGVREVVMPPQSLLELWGNIPPEPATIAGSLAPATQWLSEYAEPDDFILVQGEFGATALLVHEAFRLGLKPVYATTERRAVEELLENGDVRISHCFRHVRFRQYEVHMP